LTIIPDFGLVGSNCVLAGDGVGCFGAEEEVEVAGEGEGDGFDAAGAEDLEVAAIVGAEADVVDEVVGAAAFDDQFGSTFYGEWAGLAKVGGVLEGSGSDGFVEFEGFVYELERCD
jgi:hypothetical protein